MLNKYDISGCHHIRNFNMDVDVNNYIKQLKCSFYIAVKKISQTAS